MISLSTWLRAWKGSYWGNKSRNRAADRIDSLEDTLARVRADRATLVWAAQLRINWGHSATCSVELLGKGATCDCGHDALVAALANGEK